MSDKEVKVPTPSITKSFLEEQIRVLQRTIDQNIGVLNFCSVLLKKEMYAEEPKQERGLEEAV